MENKFIDVQEVSEIIAGKFIGYINSSDIDFEDLKQELILKLLESNYLELTRNQMVAVCKNKALDIVRYYKRRSDAGEFYREEISEIKENENCEERIAVHKFDKGSKVAELKDFLSSLDDREFIWAMMKVVETKPVDIEDCLQDEIKRMEEICNKDFSDILQEEFYSLVGLSIYSGSLTKIKNSVREKLNSYNLAWNYRNNQLLKF